MYACKIIILLRLDKKKLKVIKSARLCVSLEKEHI